MHALWLCRAATMRGVLLPLAQSQLTARTHVASGVVSVCALCRWGAVLWCGPRTELGHQALPSAGQIEHAPAMCTHIPGHLISHSDVSKGTGLPHT